MAAPALRSEERIGLGLALAAHAGLVVWLMLATRGPAPLPMPERMTVTLSDDVGLTSTAPQPAPAAAPAEAPVLAQPIPEPAPAQPQPSAAPQPARPIPLPAPVAQRQPAPPRPAPAPPAPVPARPSVARAAPAPAKPAPTAAKPAGASRIGADFLKGANTAQGQSHSAGTPAASIGPQVKAALSAAILRQIKPKWQGRVPQGVDTEQLVSIVAVALNPDGSLAGTPQLLGQEGVNDANRAQARRHAEEAIRAVQLAAPFNLPAELYDAWKKPPPLRMRKSL